MAPSPKGPTISQEDGDQLCKHTSLLWALSQTTTHSRYTSHSSYTMTFDWETTSGFSPCLGWQIHSQLPVHVACDQISLVVWELLCLASGSKFQESTQKVFMKLQLLVGIMWLFHHTHMLLTRPFTWVYFSKQARDIWSLCLLAFKIPFSRFFHERRKKSFWLLFSFLTLSLH